MEISCWVGILFSTSSSLLQAFMLLRVCWSDTPWPYRVPLGTIGCVAMLGLPTTLIVVVFVAIRLMLQLTLRFLEKKRLLPVCRQCGGAASIVPKPRCVQVVVSPVTFTMTSGHML
jgi:hypothetical protein